MPASCSARLLLITVIALALAPAGGCSAGRRYTAEEARAAATARTGAPKASSARSRSAPGVESASSDALEKPSLVVGEFPLDGAASVVDGDTLRVPGLKGSLRLLGLDTEETFKKEKDRQAFAAGWEQYKKSMRGTSDRPVKIATPLGEEAKHYAQGFFEGVNKIRIERDHPDEIRDYFDRYLSYIFVEKSPSNWVNYNVECVRAGMSPYFVKYGRSRRFHKEFMAAQEEARKNALGIWDPKKQHYDDYEERLVWWNAREEAVTRFEKRMEEDPNYIALTRRDALRKLEERLGQSVVVLGSVNEVRGGSGGPALVKLGRSRGNDFDVVFYDQDVLRASGIAQSKGEYVQVKGVVSKYFDSRRNLHKLQLVVSLPGQVIAPSRELDELMKTQKEADNAD